MQTVTLVLALGFLTYLWATIALKVVDFVIRAINPKFFPSWYAAVVRFAPTWRLFGQVGATFDLYDVIGDEKAGEPEHFHSTYGNTRRWYHPILNPYSRYRYLLRELMQMSMYFNLSKIPTRPANVQAESKLADVVRYEMRQLHPEDFHDRAASLYVIFDRGFFTDDPPEAKLTLGPFTY